jgi:hypothetical protein
MWAEEGCGVRTKCSSDGAKWIKYNKREGTSVPPSVGKGRRDRCPKQAIEEYYKNYYKNYYKAEILKERIPGLERWCVVGTP